MDPVAERRITHLEKYRMMQCWRAQVSLGRDAGLGVNFSQLWNYLRFALFISFLNFLTPKALSRRFC